MHLSRIFDYFLTAVPRISVLVSAPCPVPTGARTPWPSPTWPAPCRPRPPPHPWQWTALGKLSVRTLAAQKMRYFCLRWSAEHFAASPQRSHPPQGRRGEGDFLTFLLSGGGGGGVGRRGDPILTFRLASRPIGAVGLSDKGPASSPPLPFFRSRGIDTSFILGGRSRKIVVGEKKCSPEKWMPTVKKVPPPPLYFSSVDNKIPF